MTPEKQQEIMDAFYKQEMVLREKTEDLAAAVKMVEELEIELKLSNALNKL